MTVKPQFQALIIVGAMAFAAVLSYGILTFNGDDAGDTGGEPALEVKAAPTPMETQALTPQAPLPPLTFYDLEGKALTLADFRGEVLLVNLWATWCMPCVVELPALEKLQARMKGRKFRVVAISVDRDPAEKIAAFLKDKRIEQLVPYHDLDRQVPSKWQYAGIPTSFLIDADGNVLKKYDGPFEWDTGDVFEQIDRVVE